MKRKDLEKIKGMAATDLAKDLRDKADKLWKLRADIAAGKSKNVRAASALKRDIARVKTILNKKQREAATQGK